MGYSARIIADSISSGGGRLTTMEITYPHMCHKDLLRHGRIRRSVLSFRALPPEKLEAMLEDDNCYVPEVFTERIKGMGGGGPLPPAVQEECRRAWLIGKNAAVNLSKYLVSKGVAKEQANTPIQDYCWITEIVTATEWTNFFALRLERKPDGTPMARHEVFKIASMMKEIYDAGQPTLLSPGQWHLPLITDAELSDLCDARRTLGTDELERAVQQCIRVSARRCARVSFDKHTDTEPWEVSLEKAKQLLDYGHLSPFEHQGRPAEYSDVEFCIPYSDGELYAPCDLDFGHMRGWVPARYEIPHEDNYALAKAAAAHA